MNRFANAAPVFAALGDETRLFIIRRLCDCGPLSTARLTEGSRVSRQAVAKHLSALSAAGLVKSERAGRERIWKLETKRLDLARAYLARVSQRWDDALERLRALVESD